MVLHPFATEPKQLSHSISPSELISNFPRHPGAHIAEQNTLGYNAPNAMPTIPITTNIALVMSVLTTVLQAIFECEMWYVVVYDVK